MARWTRAIAALPFATGCVLDLGCAFGFSTRMLRRRGFEAVGVDSSRAYIERAKRADPTGNYRLGDVTAVPLPNASVDGVLFLDVMEHVPDERGAIAEIARVLRPGGMLVLSVPHKGPLAWLDSLNLYAAFVRLTRRGQIPPEIAATAVHQHYSVAEVFALLGDAFEMRRVMRTGLGVAEVVHLPVLLLCRWLVPWERAYEIAAFAYYTVYLVEDLVPFGRAGYHLMVIASRREAVTQT